MPISSITNATGCDFFSSTPDSIFTVEQFQGDDALMIQAAEQFSRGEVLPLVERLDHQEDGLMPSLIQKAGELGFCGIDSPETFGGLGQSKNLAARILEYLSLNGSFSVTYGITSGISQVGLSLFGNESQKAKYLPLLSTGEWMGAYALSEPNSGSDALSVTTRAEQHGNKWILNGTKMWISNAKWADLFLVMAKINGDQFSAFLVEKDFPGVSVSREEHKMGLKGSSTARLVLENAEVPLENLLYEPGLGHQVAFNALNLGRFKLSSMSIGPARHAIEVASDYAQDRKQFGKSIASFGLIEKKFALMAALFFAAESMIYRTGALIDSAFSQFAGDIEGNKRAASEFAVECSACKVFSTEVEGWIVDEALQTYGGYGFTEEFPIARIYRDARVSRIYEGTNEINRIFLADRLIRKAKEGTASLEGVADSFVAELAAKAVRLSLSGQIEMGALSDLIMLQYAEQSARIRTQQVGNHTALLYEAFLPWVNVRAAEAYQTLSGESIVLPQCAKPEYSEIAKLLYQKKSPL